MAVVTNKWETAQTKLVVSLRNAFPRLKRVRKHGGKFDFGEAKRFATSPLSAKVAWLGTTIGSDKVNRASNSLPFGIYIIARDKPNAEAYTTAMNWAEKIKDWLITYDLGLDFISSVQIRSVDNYYGSEIDKHGIAITGIMFDLVTTPDDFLVAASNVQSVDIVHRVLRNARPGNFEARHKFVTSFTALAEITTESGLKEWGRVSMDRKSSTHKFEFVYDPLINLNQNDYIRLNGNFFLVNTVENKNETNERIIAMTSFIGDETKVANH